MTVGSGCGVVPTPGCPHPLPETLHQVPENSAPEPLFGTGDAGDTERPAGPPPWLDFFFFFPPLSAPAQARRENKGDSDPPQPASSSFFFLQSPPFGLGSLTGASLIGHLYPNRAGCFRLLPGIASGSHPGSPNSTKYFLLECLGSWSRSVFRTGKGRILPFWSLFQFFWVPRGLEGKARVTPEE